MKVITKADEIDVRAIIHSDDMLIIYDCRPPGKELGMKLAFVPLKAIAPARLQAGKNIKELGDKAHSFRKSRASAPYEYNPDLVLSEVDGYQTSRQLLVTVVRQALLG